MPLTLRKLSNIAEDIVIKLTDVTHGNLNNRDKANILGELIQHKGFVTKLKDNETKTVTKVFRNINEIDVEYNDNMNVAKTLNRLGYNVFMLPKLLNSKSPDFILKKGNNIYLYELKTIYGKNSLNHRLEKASLQSDRIILNIVGNVDSRYVADTIKDFYLQNRHIKAIKVLLGGKPIDVRYGHVQNRKFVDLFMRWWAR
ncbi:MAG: hypothetical protein LBF39_04295 [Prevotellaceae bacterium]|jgi:hypothetical protein|nr:hypothetical protein [Prevotellaceae bacterium]